MKPKSLIFLIIGMIAFSCQKDESLSVVSITSFSPTSGIVGTVVTISGTNFSTTAAQNVVKFGSVVATVTSATNTEIKTTVPAGVVSAPISVTVNGKTATSKDAFSLTPPPTITSFTPTQGPIGIDVVIAGTNFTTNLSMVTVKFNGATAVVKSTTETSITATVPAEAGTGVISVSIGQQQVGSSTPFTLLPRPAITGVSTKRAFEGDRLVISGNGFSPNAANNKVTFGTIPVPLIISATSDKLVVAVPTGGIDGNIVVTSEGVASEPFASFDVLNEISISTLAGRTTAFGASDGTGSAATFWSPAGMVTDNSGNVLVCEPLNHTIRKITPQGVVTTLAGGTFGYADGVNNNAQFEGPVTIVKDISGVFFVADGVRIRKLNVQGSVATVTTFVGSTNGYQDGIGAAAKFKSITSMTIDGDGNLYVTDASDYRIRKITPLGLVSTLAGNGSYGYVNNTGTTAQFQSLAAIMFDKVNNTLLVADGASIRKVVPSTQVVSTLIGASGNVSEYVNGSFADARFGNQISSIVAGPLGDFFVMDRVNNRIRRLVLQDDRAYSFMGSGLAGFSDGIPTDVKFNSPYALLFDEQGNLFVSDSYNNIIRKVSIK